MEIFLSPSAVERIAAILQKEKKYALRLSIIGGKCSGFAYDYALVDKRNDDDFLVEQGQAKVVIDPISLPFLEGAKVDFVDDLIGQSFKIENPNAASSCGCGLSFSI